MNRPKNIFMFTTSGSQGTDRHYYDTIETRRHVEEFRTFLTLSQVKKLEEYAHGRSYAIWGAVPGKSNTPNWEKMNSGDYTLAYREGKIILAAEVALKIRNSKLAEYFWGRDKHGQTWEYMYFLINDIPLNLDVKTLNKYLNYKESYTPQGFTRVKEEKATTLLSTYGDLFSSLKKLNDGDELEKIDFALPEQEKHIPFSDETEKQPSVHTKIQWYLIQLGKKSGFDVWVPSGDQSKKCEGEIFRDHTINKFQESLDVPNFIKNIDVVWKLGHSIKGAFEIEHSTSIYSGILRLSDLKICTPNSIYPLFIVADKKRRHNVFKQLHRPTFSNRLLNLPEAVRYLSYDTIQKLNKEIKEEHIRLDMEWLIRESESATTQ